VSLRQVGNVAVHEYRLSDRQRPLPG